MKKKVSCKNKIEFINEVAEDCLKDMSVEDKEYLMENPVAIEYHFSYCLYIRNNYIHNRGCEKTQLSFFASPFFHLLCIDDCNHTQKKRSSPTP